MLQRCCKARSGERHTFEQSSNGACGMRSGRAVSEAEDQDVGDKIYSSRCCGPEGARRHVRRPEGTRRWGCAGPKARGGGVAQARRHEASWCCGPGGARRRVRRPEGTRRHMELQPRRREAARAQRRGGGTRRRRTAVPEARGGSGGESFLQPPALVHRLRSSFFAL